MSTTPSRPDPRRERRGLRPRGVARRVALLAAVVSISASVMAVSMGASVASAGVVPAKAHATTAPVGRVMPASEQRLVASLDHAAIARIAKPALLPRAATTATPAVRADQSDGPTLTVAPTSAPRVGSAASAARIGSRAAAARVDGLLWPGGSTANPNRQVGKLYFDADPSAAFDWRQCTATVINSENKSLLLTAGHCVFNPDKRQWYTNLWFYPGYENGKHLGAWPVRQFATTNNWFNRLAWADDMAIALVSRDSSGGAIANRLGGHGIAFNGNVNVTRTAFGYPMTDPRFPGFTASGEDLYYCQGVDTYYSSGAYTGQMSLPCRMTGGASGGPWLSNVRSDWLGTVTSVNSNKTNTGIMFAPYLGAQEQAVFQAYRAA